MYNLSSAMAAHFAEIAAEMTAKMKAIGPSPLREKQEAKS
jgi:coenzyme F420-reducing hydrogenase delta subunit